MTADMRPTGDALVVAKVSDSNVERSDQNQSLLSHGLTSEAPESGERKKNCDEVYSCIISSQTSQELEGNLSMVWSFEPGAD
jgi:hypothetical protein